MDSREIVQDCSFKKLRRHPADMTKYSPLSEENSFHFLSFSLSAFHVEIPLSDLFFLVQQKVPTK
jgi:hypothetical protein